MEFDFAVITDHARFLASGVGVTLLLASVQGKTQGDRLRTLEILAASGSAVH